MRSVLVLTLASLATLFHGAFVEASERTTLLRVALTLVPGCLVRDLERVPLEGVQPEGAPRQDEGGRLRVSCSRGSEDFAVTAETLRASAAPVAANTALGVVAADASGDTRSGSRAGYRSAQHDGIDDEAVRLTILW